MFITRKPVQHLIIVPISLDFPASKAKNAPESQNGVSGTEQLKEYALQYKKQSTAFVENFQSALAQEGDSAVELHVATRKSAVRIIVLEKKRPVTTQDASVQRPTSATKESVSKKYKLRLSVSDLMYDTDSERTSEWKLLTVMLKDGCQLVLRSRRCSNEDCTKQAHASGSIAPTNVSDDEDLSTIIANGLDEREAQDELMLELEERDLEIKNLKLRLKEMQGSAQHAHTEKDTMVVQLQEKILMLQQKNEQMRDRERQARELVVVKQREYDTLMRHTQHLEARLKEIHPAGSAAVSTTTESTSTAGPQRDPMWVQRSLQLYNHVALLEQEIFSLKKLFDYDRFQHEEKENDLIKKLRYYQQRDEKIQREKQKLLEFVSRGETEKSQEEGGVSTSKRSSTAALTPDHYSLAQIQSLPESLKALEYPLEQLELILSTLSEYLADRIETEPHDRLLSDVFNPVIKTIVQALSSVLLSILNTGLTGPWRLTRRNTVWDLITQHHMNLFTRNNRQHQALSEEELSLYYAVRAIRKNLDEKLSGSDWEPRFNSWVRVALNKQSLCCWICLILQDEEVVRAYFDTSKSLLFQEKQRVDGCLRALESVPFALNEY